MKPFFLVVGLLPALACAQTAEQIMAKVAESQTRAEAARRGFIYRQNVLVRMLYTGGKLAREEDREYAVTPEPDGIEREMVHFAGKYSANGTEVAYADPDEAHSETQKGVTSGIDTDVVKSLGEDFGSDKDSRDGVNQDLFPLTLEKQKGYAFRLAGRETWQGHQVLRISFEPRIQKDSGQHDDDTHWAGEVLVDRTDLTPVLITTHLAHGVPVLVKTLLGTNVQQLGFRVEYGKFDDNLWFPVNYSGDLKIRVLFMYARTITVRMVNSGFKKADVKSTFTPVE